jgi:hypothetical protein
MRCSGCGKKIPSYGQVCPFCHRDKSADKAVQGTAMVCGVIGGGIGYLFGGFGGFLVGMIPGLIVGGIIGMLGNKEAGRAPPTVRVEPSASAAPSHRYSKAYAFEHELKPKDDTAERLSKLKGLRDSGIITEAEYADSRAKILGDI